MRTLLVETFAVFAAVLLIYLICAAGYSDTTDVEPSLDTARVLLERGTFKIFPGPPNTFFARQWKERGPDTYLYARSPSKGWYSKMGLSLPVLYVPAVWGGNFLSRWTHAPELTIRFLVSLMNAFFLSLTAALVYFFFRIKKYAKTPAALVAFSLAFATQLLPYSKMCHREPLQALTITATYVFLAISEECAFTGLWLTLAGISASLAILTKQVALVPLLPTFLWFLSDQRLKTLGLRVTGFLIPIVGSLFLWALFDHYAFGSAFQSGYSPAVMAGHAKIWSTPFWAGMREQWVSWDYGFFFYNPILILCPIGVAAKLVSRRLTRFDLMILAAALLQSCLYARWVSPSGIEALGPRYLVVILPLLVLSLDGFSLPCAKQTFFYWATASLLFFSLLTQLAHTSVKAQQYWTLRSRAGVPLSVPHWLANLKMAWHKGLGKSEIYSTRDYGASENRSISLNNVKTLVGFNYWWLHLYQWRAAQKTLQPSPPNSESVSKMDQRGHRNRQG
jgi:Dolichyl-phosphate-mannose-protein mannosyltransferase